MKLAVPSQSIQVKGNGLKIPCLKLDMPITFRSDFTNEEAEDRYEQRGVDKRRN